MIVNGIIQARGVVHCYQWRDSEGNGPLNLAALLTFIKEFNFSLAAFPFNVWVSVQTGKPWLPMQWLVMPCCNR